MLSVSEREIMITQHMYDIDQELQKQRAAACVNDIRINELLQAKSTALLALATNKG